MMGLAHCRVLGQESCMIYNCLWSPFFSGKVYLAAMKSPFRHRDCPEISNTRSRFPCPLVLRVKWTHSRWETVGCVSGHSPWCCVIYIFPWIILAHPAPHWHETLCLYLRFAVLINNSIVASQSWGPDTQSSQEDNWEPVTLCHSHSPFHAQSQAHLTVFLHLLHFIPILKQ